MLEKLSLHRTQSSFKQFYTLYIVLNRSFIQFRAVILLYFYAVLRCVQHDIDPGGSVHRCHHHRLLLGQTTLPKVGETQAVLFVIVVIVVIFVIVVIVVIFVVVVAIPRWKRRELSVFYFVYDQTHHQAPAPS